MASFGGIGDLGEQSLGGGGGSSYPNTSSTQAPPVPPIPFNLRHSSAQSQTEHKAEDLPGAYDPMDLDNSSRPTSSLGVQSPLSDKTSRVANTNISGSYRSSASAGSAGGWVSRKSREDPSANGSANGSEGYSKLSRGDVGYGGVFGRPGTPEPGEGLLARRLRGLGMERDA